MKKQAGFTLIEFMVAMAVTLVSLGAAMIAFRDSARTNQNVSLGSDMSDNLRAGVNIIQQDLILAGTGIPTGGISIPSTPTTTTCPSAISAVKRPTLTASAATFPQCNLVIAAIEPGPGMGPLVSSPDATAVSNSDILTMMYADNTLGLDQNQINQPASGSNPGCPGGSITSTGNAATFDSTCMPLSGTGVQINPGDLIMFSNAKGNALQEVTSVSGQTISFATSDAFQLNGTGDSQGTLIQLQNTNTSGVPNGTYPPTTLTRIWMISYYLDNITDPAHVRLVRRVNFNPAQPVGETMETLSLTYNYVNGATVLANQAGIPTGYSENQIRSVNLTLGSRSSDTVFKNNKSAYLRSSVQTLVCLRGMAYVNKYQ